MPWLYWNVALLALSYLTQSSFCLFSLSSQVACAHWGYIMERSHTFNYEHFFSTNRNSKTIAISIRQFKWSCDRRTECFRKNHVIVGRHLVCICSPQNNECSLEQTWKITCRKITSDGQRSDRTAGPAAAAAASGPPRAASSSVTIVCGRFLISKQNMVNF